MSDGQRGMFIVLEGPDGAGITTQAALLRDALVSRGFKAFTTKEPTNGPIGSVIRQALSHRLVYPPSTPTGDEVMALLYAADRLDHLQADIVPRLEAGTHVICDRYLLSSYAYQGLTVGQEWVRALNSRAMHPDLTVFINVPPEVSQSRISGRGGYVELYESDARLRPIYGNYLQLIDELTAAGSDIRIVDGTLSRDGVTAAILSEVMSVISIQDSYGGGKPRYTFHYTPIERFAQFADGSDYTPIPFEREGFIHCTDGAANMVKVVNSHYKNDTADYIVLYIDKSKVKSPIKYEDPGEIYPHIYGPLNQDAIVQTKPALRDPDGTFLQMPELDES